MDRRQRQIDKASTRRVGFREVKEEWGILNGEEAHGFREKAAPTRNDRPGPRGQGLHRHKGLR